jgi:TRAP-type uncharacterized transport system fused permease subunit
MTKQYDAEAMRYLSYALYPLVIGYAIYALVYETHRSWYSWVLHSLVGAVYTFGFILMCPQVRACIRHMSLAFPYIFVSIRSGSLCSYGKIWLAVDIAEEEPSNE